MTVDKHTLDKAREWAKAVHPGHHPEAVATAEVILSLPEIIVDGDKLREWIESMKVSDQPGGAQALIDYLKRDFLPTPQVGIKLGAWAMHPKHGKVLIVATKTYRDRGVLVAFPDERNATGAAYEWVPATSLSPLPDTHDDSEGQSEYAPGGVLPGRTSAEKEQIHRTLEKLNQQYTEPQPGEAWLIRTESGDCREAVLDNDGDWNGTDDRGGYDVWRKNVIPLRRLVPAQEPRVLVTEQDYREAADDTIVRRPGNANATYEKWSRDDWRSTVGTRHTDREMAENSGPRTVLWEPK